MRAAYTIIFGLSIGGGLIGFAIAFGIYHAGCGG